MAYESISNEFEEKEKKKPNHLLHPVLTPGLKVPSGAFVSLHTKKGHKLKGCIGRIVSMDPLYKTVMDMARQAAFHDSRFSKLEKKELDDILIEISVLNQPKKVSNFHEIELGKHGIIMNKFSDKGKLEASSVFLPQVPVGCGWDLRTTLQQLSEKAGIGKDGWKDGAEFEVFESVVLKEDIRSF